MKVIYVPIVIYLLSTAFSILEKDIIVRNVWTTIWAISLYFIVKMSGEKLKGFFKFNKHSSYAFAVVFWFMVGAIIELLGMYWKLWFYEFLLKFPILIFIIPIYYALFGLLVVESFSLINIYFGKVVRHGLVSNIASFTVVTTLLFLMIEGFNIFTRSWTYTGYLTNYAILYLAWFPLTFAFLLPYLLLKRNIIK